MQKSGNEATLFIDFGATRIKWLIEKNCDLKCIKYGELQNPYVVSGYKTEIDIKLFKKQIINLVESVVKRYDLKSILVSSQMHGFLLQDYEGNLITNYISWMDQRYFKENIREYESFCNEYSKLFLETTGMPIKSGLPFFNSISICRVIKTKHDIKILSLPELFLSILGIPIQKIHVSMAAGLGFYDIYKDEISDSLLDLHCKLSGGRHIQFNQVTKESKLFSTSICSKHIDVSIGFGDHQCAVLGADNTLNTISLNLGTGSQASQIVKKDKIKFIQKNKITYLRPFFRGQFLECITHIPSGRVLTQFLSILQNNPKCPDWNDVKRLTLNDLNTSSLKFDLNIFNDSWNYSPHGGGIYSIEDGSLTYKNMISSLIRSYVEQYEQAVYCLEKTQRNIRRDIIILSGGISQRIPVVKSYLENNLNKRIIVKKVENNRDETILGLKKIIDYEN